VERTDKLIILTPDASERSEVPLRGTASYSIDQQGFPEMKRVNGSSLFFATYHRDLSEKQGGNILLFRTVRGASVVLGLQEMILTRLHAQLK
jgi:hypothetical protein